MVVLAVLLALPACTAHHRASGHPASPSPTAPALTGSLQISADSSLNPVMNQLAAAFVAAHPGVRLLPVTYQGTQALTTAIEQGPIPDVLAVADPSALGALSGANAVVSATVRTFATDPLVIVVKAGDPTGIQTLSDLAKPGVAVVLPDPSLPLGTEAAQVLAQAGVHLTAPTTTLAAAAVVQDVGGGAANAGVVAASDVVTGGSPVTAVAIPAPVDVAAQETIAVLANSPNQQVATAFAAYLLSPGARSTLTAAGFQP
jgi:molybdate transport system substrate-binding protein